MARWMEARRHACTNTHTYIHTHKHTHTHIYIYIYIYIYTHTLKDSPIDLRHSFPAIDIDQSTVLTSYGPVSRLLPRTCNCIWLPLDGAISIIYDTDM